MAISLQDVIDKYIDSQIDSQFLSYLTESDTSGLYNYWQDLSLFDACKNYFNCPDFGYHQERWCAELLNDDDSLVLNYPEYFKVYHKGSDIKLFIKPRGWFKTSLYIVGYASWILYREPNAKILIASKKIERARERLTAIKGNLDPLDETTRMMNLQSFGFESLKPLQNDDKRVWTQNKISTRIRTDLKEKEASVTCTAVKSDPTGGHYHYILCDDIITGIDYDSEKERENTKNFFSRLMGLKEPSGCRIIVANTIYHFDDLSQDICNDEDSSIDYYWESAFRKDGGASWEERYSLERLAQIEKDYKVKYFFNVDYRCDPTPTGEKVFDVSKFFAFTRNDLFQDQTGRWNIIDDTNKQNIKRRSLFPICFVDPSEEVGNDDTAIGIGLYDAYSSGVLYLMDMKMVQWKEEYQVDYLVSMQGKYGFHTVHIDVTGGYRKHLRLLKKIVTDKYPLVRLSFSEVRADNTESKTRKLMNFAYYTREGLFKFPRWKATDPHFRKMFQQFQNFPATEHDDSLDVCDGLNEQGRTMLKRLA